MAESLAMPTLYVSTSIHLKTLTFSKTIRKWRLGCTALNSGLKLDCFEDVTTRIKFFFVRGNSCDMTMDEKGNSWFGYETAD
jgi:hypothetical protein